MILKLIVGVPTLFGLTGKEEVLVTKEEKPKSTMATKPTAAAALATGTSTAAAAIATPSARKLSHSDN